MTPRALLLGGLGLLALVMSPVTPLAAERVAPVTVYVDDDWTGPDACGGHVWGETAFARIQAALNAVAPGGTVLVAPGTYAEQLIIAKPVSVRGPGALQTPNAGDPANVFAASSTRGQAHLEAGIIPPRTDFTLQTGVLVSIRASEVTLDGLTLDGNNPALDGDTNILIGIDTRRRPSHVLLTNNIIRNCRGFGMRLSGGGGQSTGNLVLNNRIEQIPGDMPREHGIGLFLGGNFFAEVIGNTVTGATLGIFATSFRGPGLVKLVRNRLQVDECGIGLTVFYPNMQVESPGVEILQNTIDLVKVPAEEERANVDRLHCHAGIRLLYLHTDEMVTLADNTVTGGYAGLLVVNPSSPNQRNTGIVVRGGTMTDCQYGVKVTNRNFTWGEFHKGGEKPGRVILEGVTIRRAAVAGVQADDDAEQGANTLTLLLTNNTTIDGGPVGAVIRGRRMQLHFSRSGAGAAATLSGQTTSFLVLQHNGASAPGDIDATAVTFLHNGTSATAQELATRITDQADQPELGRVLLP